MRLAGAYAAAQHRPPEPSHNRAVFVSTSCPAPGLRRMRCTLDRVPKTWPRRGVRPAEVVAWKEPLPVHDRRTPESSDESTCLDRAILNLMLDIDRQRPWSAEEIARAIGTPGDVRDSLLRLRACKLIHRWSNLALASHPAVRFHEITQPGDPACADEHHHDEAVLESLLVRASDGDGPISEQEIHDAFGAKRRKQKLAITDVLDRLDGAGLIKRRGGRAIASEVAKRFDQIMTL